MRRYTNRCNVRSPIFDEIRHESEVSRRSHRKSVILRGPLQVFQIASGKLTEAGPRLKLPGQPASMRAPAR